MRSVTLGVLLLVAESQAFATPQEIAKTMFPKTVMITTQDQKGTPLAIGSGFVLKPGFIVSNFHVVEGAGAGFVKIVGNPGKFNIGAGRRKVYQSAL